MSRPGTYRLDAQNVVVQGIVGGVIAGIVFALFEMIMAAILGMSFFAPLRMISAIVLGPAALTPAVALGTAIVVGLIVHLVMSAIFGAIFALALLVAPALASSYPVLLLSASVYGLLLWLVNFQVIGAALFPWFTMVDQLIFGFIAHTFFFGTVLGIYIGQALPGLRSRAGL